MIVRNARSQVASLKQRSHDERHGGTGLPEELKKRADQRRRLFLRTGSSMHLPCTGPTERREKKSERPTETEVMVKDQS
jgi:hypothetical protein